MNKAIDILENGAHKLGFDLSPRGLDSFRIYLEELQRWNKRFRLVGNPDPIHCARRHMLDSLTVAPFLSSVKGIRIIDVGSGAGFPGLPLAILFPCNEFVLLEARSNRAEFLRTIIRKTKITNCSVCHSRLEAPEVSASYQGYFHTVLARGFAALEKVITTCAFLLRDNGTFVLHRGHEACRELKESWDIISGHAVIPELLCLSPRYELTDQQEKQGTKKYIAVLRKNGTGETERLREQILGKEDNSE